MTLADENMTDISDNNYDPSVEQHEALSSVDQNSYISEENDIKRSVNEFRFVDTKSKNLLLELAIPILALTVRIRNLHDFDQVEKLHLRMTNEIQHFQHALESIPYDEATILAARYILCSALDEAVLSQLWGAESIWAENPMLSIYHNETWGGEKFFSILDRVFERPDTFIDVLELIYYCLVLGFEGKYHVVHNGQARLETVVSKIYKEIVQWRGIPPEQLTFPENAIFESKKVLSYRLSILGMFSLGFIAILILHFFFDIPLTSQVKDIAFELDSTLNLLLENSNVENWER